MQSTGGILDAETVTRVPARIVECGPAAGVIGAAFQARRTGHLNVITLDMGGTTAKAAMIENGGLVRTDEYEVGGGISLSSRLVKGGGYALKLPMIDISEVGAGGGSIAWFDRGNALKVGPASAGAVPGPACYGLGGENATVTDASVVLGFINPTALAGGTVGIDAGHAHCAVEAYVARPLGVTARDAAWAVHVVATANMMRAVKAVSTYRGRDPRDCVLMAFGGNGGIFAVELARQLQIATVLIPPAAGVFSAIGLGVAPVEFGQTRAYLRRLSAVDPGHLRDTYAALVDAVRTTLGRPPEDLNIAYYAAMRYVGQAFELPIPVPSSAPGPGELACLRVAFAQEHERTYGHRSDNDADVEVVAVQVVGTVRASASDERGISLRQRSALARTERECFFGPEGGAQMTPVFDRTGLGEQPLAGPLVIEEYEGTTVVPPGASAALDAQGNIVIVTKASFSTGDRDRG
jgi:N-methylhydantoinase A